MRSSVDTTVSPWYAPSFGSIRWFVHQPIIIVTRIVDAAMKYQLHAESTRNVVSSPSRILIDVFVIPAKSESVPAIIRFAEKPALAEIQPQSKPATGLLPTPKNAMAASGGTRTEQVSDARLPHVPMRATM